MKTVIAALLAGSAAAQTVQSKPFNLVAQSSDNSINGKGFSACHTGAAIESLCIGPDKAVFHHNTTEGIVAPIKGDSAPGILTYTLPTTPPEDEPMSFYADPSTNVALPLLEPSNNAQYVAFDDKDLMNVISNLNDAVTPPSDETSTALYRWYVCQTNFEGYQYQTLAWVYGNGKPQNPTCVKADVKRVFV